MTDKQYSFIFANTHTTRQMWESHLVGHAIASPSGQYAACNETFAKMLHRDAHEIEGKHYSAFLNKDDAGVTKYLIDGVLQGQLPSYEMQKRMLLPNNRETDILIGVRPIRDEDMTFICFFIVAIPIDMIKNRVAGVGVPTIPISQSMVEESGSFDDLDKKVGFVQKVILATVGLITLLGLLGAIVAWLVNAFNILDK